MVRAAAVIIAMARLSRVPLRACSGAAPSTKQTLRLLGRRVDVERDPARHISPACRAYSKRVAALTETDVRDATPRPQEATPRGPCDLGTTLGYPSGRNRRRALRTACKSCRPQDPGPVNGASAI